MKTVSLTERDVMAALARAESRGVRGGAVYDYLHLVAARKSGADAPLTRPAAALARLLSEIGRRVLQRPPAR